MTSRLLKIIILWTSLTFTSLALSQSPLQKPGDSPKGKGSISGNKVAPPSTPASPAAELKKYDDVITKNFVTQAGVFAVHRFEEKVFFEIPKELLGKLFFGGLKLQRGLAVPVGVVPHWVGKLFTLSAEAIKYTFGKMVLPSVLMARPFSLPSRQAPPIPSSPYLMLNVKAKTGPR